MKINYPNTIFIAIMFLMSSFSNENVSLEKIWVYQKYNEKNQTFIYESGVKFKDAMCFQFLLGGKAKIRQNVSGCGTVMPGKKIEYETVEGIWTLTPDSVLIIQHLQFGIENTQRLKVVKVTEKQLIVKMGY